MQRLYWRKLIRGRRRNEFQNVNNILWTVVLFVLFVLYFGAYWNRLIPYSEGWGINYAELISSGKVPYRDFYFYMPPLNLLIDWLIWKLSFHYIIIYRLWRCLERFVIGILFYKILKRVTKPEYACIASFLGLVIEAATVYDLLGDYNQTSNLLVLIMIKLLIDYIDIFNIDERREKRKLFCCGIVLGLIFLLKQTVFLAVSVLYFGILTYIFIVNKKRDYIRSVLAVVAGILVPFFLTFLYLWYNDALGAFILQVYLDMDAKGSIFDILLAFPRTILNYKTIILSFTIAAGIVYLEWVKKRKYSEKVKNFLLIYVMINCISIYGLMYSDALKSFGQIVHRKEAFYIAGIILLCVFLYLCKEKNIYRRSFACGFIVTLFIISILYVSAHGSFSSYLYFDIGAFDLLEELPCIYTLLSIILLFRLLFQYKKGQEKEILVHIVILVGGISISFACGMASGESMVSNRAGIILVPYLAVYTLSIKLYGEKIKKLFAITGMFIICTICMSQKIACAYSWWGWEDGVISFADSYDIEIEDLKGFRVNQNVKDMYEEITHVVEDNTDKDSVIYGFPYVKIFNILTENYQMNNFVPVPFYDVCSDSYAKEDAILLQGNPPDIVIWCDIPYCMETHERVFRNGEALGQRDIQNWFSTAVAREEYVLIAQYDSLFVYKKASDIPVGYTYFKSDKVFNTTLKSAEELGIVQEFFKGNGTEKSPYLIRNEEEFNKFRFLVNSGCRFTNCYFRQTRNLQFDKSDIYAPIGKWSEGTYFDGVYDGGNYYIAGLNIQEDSDAGLFGLLGGTVENLTIRDSTIKGRIGAGIAAHALTPAALIMNCNVENTVAVYGERAGGIVDDFSGGIIECRSKAKTYSTAMQEGKIYSYRIGYAIDSDEN